MSAKEISNISSRGSKRKTPPTRQQPKEARKPKLLRTPSPVDSPVDEAFQNTPSTRRSSAHSSLINHAILATDVELQIVAEARGSSRKDIPWDTFHSIYLCDFEEQAQSMPTIESVQNLGHGNWE